MNLRTLVCTAAFALTGSAGASALTLTFDDLVTPLDGWYGDGSPLLPSMAVTDQSLIYTAQGYRLTYVTPNALPGKTHIGDGARPGQTFNWHTGFDNAAGGYVELTQVGGGAFTLYGFDYDFDGLVMTAGSLSVPLAGAGHYASVLAGVTSVVFTPNAEFFNSGLDNVAVSTPEPAAWALMLIGFAALGALARRERLQRAVSTASK